MAIQRYPLKNAEKRQGPNLYEYVKNRSLNLRDPFVLEGGEGFVLPGNPAPQNPWDPRVPDQGRQNYICALQHQQIQELEDLLGEEGLALSGMVGVGAPEILGYALTNPGKGSVPSI